ncbi:MAG: CmpA/NrtA family ABC transporter substrate-binding protein [Verrucomicrobiia bacterium]
MPATVAQKSTGPHRRPPRTSRPTLALGFIPLTDCAPVVAAQEWGFFRDEGLHLRLVREVGWASIRERLVFGEIDAAQALAPMAFTIKLGLAGPMADVLTAFVLNLQGNAITLSRALRQKGVTDATTFGQLARSERPRRMTLGIVASHSMHHILLRRWLAQAGLRPERDVRIVTLPPPQMARSLGSGAIDGFCVGEPWNTLAVRTQIGWCPALSSEIIPLHPEKILLVRGAFAVNRPDEHLALIRALDRACRQCETPEGRAELVNLLARKEYLNLAPQILKPALLGPFDRGNGQQAEPSAFHHFFRSAANDPSPDKALLLFQQMQAAGLLPPEPPTPGPMLTQVFRQDLYRQALFPQPQPQPQNARP